LNNQLSAKEKEYVRLVKSLACSVCDASGPSDAHHIKQHRQYTVVALCKSCHQGAIMGWHGQKRMWAIKKMDELDALDITIQRAIKQLSLSTF
jgi:hypothetical protein